MITTFLFLSSPGPSPASFCFNMSMIAQAEYKAKARFLALLRRSRLWSAAQRTICLSTLQGQCKPNAESSLFAEVRPVLAFSNAKIGCFFLRFSVKNRSVQRGVQRSVICPTERSTTAVSPWKKHSKTELQCFFSLGFHTG